MIRDQFFYGSAQGSRIALGIEASEWCLVVKKNFSRGNVRTAGNIEQNGKIVDFGFSVMAYFALYLVFIWTSRYPVDITFYDIMRSLY